MARGISLHIGLNVVDPGHYHGWDGQLNACENDASDMERIAAAQEFETSLLLRDHATRENVKNAISQAADSLKPGDIFYISYSGHGGQLPDLNGDEPDGQDETWCLFDGELLDDELNELWMGFPKGVRILVTSDSCHSGTIVKEATNNMVVFSDFTPRFMDSQHALSTYCSNREFYDHLLQKQKKVSATDIRASMILISGCQDNQYSYDGTFNGAFTGALKRVWNGGQFNRNYRVFHKQIQSLLPAYQSPNYLTYGCPDPDFENQKPFTI
ncbi:MAG: caspase family protein [Mangrovibacterium sp.]|nr:caspase family protein [Mangrovibacterium sp.]